MGVQEPWNHDEPSRKGIDVYVAGWESAGTRIASAGSVAVAGTDVYPAGDELGDPNQAIRWIRRSTNETLIGRPASEG